MKNDTSENEDIFNLVLTLRKEKLFIKSEKNNIQELNEVIKTCSHNIIKSTWVTNKQRMLLCQREIYHNYQMMDFLQNSEFIESKNVFGSQQSVKVANLLHLLRSQPKELAKWLVAGEEIVEEGLQFSLVLHSIVNGLYGSFIFSEDTKYMLSLLYELARLQLSKGENPRSIIKQRTCSFRHLYFLFHEVLLPAKFFLSAALEAPVLLLMSYTEYYLDLDPDKTVMRFKQGGECLSKFRDAMDYRNEIVLKLSEFTNNFVTSILENVQCFPKSIAWIIYHIAKLIEKPFGPKEVNMIKTELIFTLFICPVIVDPEQYGICNSQVTDLARHNLIQVGQILQSLALHKFESIDKKYADIFSLLDKNSIIDFFNALFLDIDESDPPIDSAPIITRNIMLFTEQELLNLILFMQKIQCNINPTDSIGKALPLNMSIEENLASLSLTRDSHISVNNDVHNSEGSTKKNIFPSLGSRNQSSKTSYEEYKKPAVLIFPIDRSNSIPVGFLPEEKVIDMTVTAKSEQMFVCPTPIVNTNIQEETTNNTSNVKQTFTNFVDEGSIGNTSDNLEAISEAASNHSVASSLELENEDQNDNLSDMVSANVSGRGTPNISGRDTPSSQVIDNEPIINQENRPEDHPPSQPNIARQIRSEIDDKFCKFEIKKLLEGDETVSLISETWSTDVLASDNEALDTSDSRERQTIGLLDRVQEVPIDNILDVSETQSESAWSTDVVTSDTERLTEVDNDDAGSVAQSDDTNSVARSDDTRSETEESAGIRRLSATSNCMNNQISQSYVANIITSNLSFSATPNNSSFARNVANINHINYDPTQNNVSSMPLTSTTFVMHDTKTNENKIEKMNGKICSTQKDNNANTIFKSMPVRPSVTFFSENSSGLRKESLEINIAGPSGLKKQSSTESETKQNLNEQKSEDGPTDTLLSNSSLNSSSSGSSCNSFENKNTQNENAEQWENKPWLNSSGSSLNVTLTPSESNSELSILNVNSVNNSSNLNKKTTSLVTSKSLRPSVSTGAIPKSISFDITADKGFDDDHRSKRGGFFGKLRMGFKNRRGKTFRNQEDLRLNGEIAASRNPTDSPTHSCHTVSEDILAKYRTKSNSESNIVKENCDDVKFSKDRNVDTNSSEVNSLSDIKKKLRLVLSNTSGVPYYVKNSHVSVKCKIETILRLELGKAKKLKEWSSVARISEALRCINMLNNDDCLKLLKLLREDLSLRSTYLQYLISSKQDLLFCHTYLKSLQDQINHDKHQCEKYFITVCVRDFLSGQESLITCFCEEFGEFHLADEKSDFLQNFYRKLYGIMNSNTLWQGIFNNRETLVKLTLERFIMSKVYVQALYPNGDGDQHRDKVLREHIAKLSKTITPHHKDLMISKTYLRESPWMPAQDALRALNASRTPGDKVKCVVRCAKCIMDLLSLSQSNGSTTADDFTPVLVYVIIKVNPESLLSTIQFVNSFHKQLFGEEEYWWTQFCAAVEFIKTMDYSD